MKFVGFNEDEINELWGDWKNDICELRLINDGHASYYIKKANYSINLNSQKIKIISKSKIVIGFKIFRKTIKITEWVHVDNGKQCITIDDNIKLYKRSIFDEKKDIPKDWYKLLENTFQDILNSIDENGIEKYESIFTKTNQDAAAYEKIKKSYTTLLENQEIMKQILIIKPIINKDIYLSNDTQLHIEGIFPTKPLFSFSLTYLYNFPEWKLVSYNLTSEIKN